MDMTPQIRAMLLTALEAQKAELDQLIDCLKRDESIALMPASQAGLVREVRANDLLQPARGKTTRTKKQKAKSPVTRSKPTRKPRVKAEPGDDQEFGRCSVEAVEAILRASDDVAAGMTAPDIISALKRRWKIEIGWRGMNVMLGKGKARGLFEYVGDRWRLVG